MATAAKPRSRKTSASKVGEMRRRNGFYKYGGKDYVSVTTVLQVLAKPALINWAAKTAANLVLDDPWTYNTAEKAAGGIYGVRDRAADRGTTVHSLAEAYLRDGTELKLEDLPESLIGYGQALRAFLDLHDPQPIELEANVYSDAYGYAGTTDLIAVYRDGRTLLTDYKTGAKGVYDESKLQLAAYRNADYILPRMPNSNCRTCNGSGFIGQAKCSECLGVGEVIEPVPLPDIDGTAVVLLNEDGTFSFHEVTAPFPVFLHALELWRWQKGLSS